MTVKHVTILSLITLVMLQCTVDRSGPEKPNVLFIFADQLRSGELGVYGGKNIKTPNLDRLAAEGIMFRNAISMAPLCTPFRGTLMSGRYPTHTGILINNLRADPDQQYIAKLFKVNGYQTGFLGKWHLNKGTSKEEEQFIPPGPYRLGFDHWEAYNYMHTFNQGYYYRDTPERLFMDKFETDFEIERAIAFLKKRESSGQPFFLMVAPHPPHPPYSRDNCPEGYWEQIKGPFHWGPNVGTRNEDGMRGYLALIKNLDDNMGRLMDYLKSSGLDKNTIVVFTSDHGELLGAHGFNGKARAYNECASIPVIMRWPDHIQAGMETGYLHSSIDHVPTLCAMAGIEIPEPVDGKDVSGLWNKEILPERESVLMANYSAGSRVGRFITDFRERGPSDPEEWRAIKTERFTYIKYIDGREELFDNISDPYQMNNLIHDGSFDHVIIERMRVELNEKMEASHDKLLPGNHYAGWWDESKMNLLRTALDPE